MSITLPLTPEATAEIERRAAAVGMDMTDFVLRAVQENLADDDVAPAKLAYDEWLEEFQQWISSHPSRNPHFDDSRGSIYD